MTADRVDNLIRRTNRLLMWSRLTTRALHASVYLIGTALLLIFADALFGLPPIGLIIIDLLILGVGLIIAGGLALIMVQSRLHAPRVALLIEQRLDLQGSKLINALELSGTPAAAGASPELTQLAVTQGNELAGQVEPGQMIEWPQIKRAALRATVGLLVVVAAYAVVPGVFGAVVPRLADPLGDHPPFTLVTFDVQIEPEAVYHGKPAIIRATLGGPITPEKAEAVFINDDGSRQRIVMLRAPQTGEEASNTYLMRIDRAEVSRPFYIDTPDGRSKRHTLHVLPVPRFEKVSATYDFPDHTGWDDADKPVGHAGMRALEGTRATLRVRSNVPLAGGTLTLEPTRDDTNTPPVPKQLTTFTPDPADPLAATATFTFTGDAELTATLTGLDGTPSDEAYTTTITAIPDKAPRVYIAEPQQRLIVPEGWVVDIAVRASDDIGVGRIRLSRGVNDWTPSQTELPITYEGKGRSRAAAAAQFDLGKLGAKAGDIITYYAIAYDTHPSGQGIAESEINVIQVITEEEYLDYERTRYRIDDMHKEFEEFQRRLAELEQQREQILDKLKALQEKIDKGQPLTPEEHAELEELNQQLEKYMDDTMALFEDLRDRTEAPTLYEFDNAYKDTLRRLAAELQPQVTAASKVQSKAKQLQGQDTPQARQAFSDAAEQFDQTKDPFTEPFEQEQQQTAQDLESLQAADELMAAGERLRMVINEQQELARRLAEFKNKKQLSAREQQTADRLAQEQAELEKELTETTQQLQSAAEAAQDRLPRMSGGAMQMVQRIGAGRIGQDMADAQHNAEQGQGKAAHKAAQQAADKLDALLGDCNSMGQQASSELDGCFNLPREQMKQALQQMAQSRGVPGMGPKGGNGSGLAGSQARMAIQGPATRGSGEGGDGRRSGGKGDGSGTGQGDVETLDPAESLSPDSLTTRGSGGGAMPGVPLQYREEAEAYFKRLAEESNANE